MKTLIEKAGRLVDYIKGHRQQNKNKSTAVLSDDNKGKARKVTFDNKYVANIHRQEVVSGKTLLLRDGIKLPANNVTRGKQ